MKLMGGMVEPVVEPVVAVATVFAPTVVTTDYGNFLLGDLVGNGLTMSFGVIGLAGMGGNDTLTAGDSGSFLFGDDFAADLFAENPVSMFYDFTIKGNDLLIGGAGSDLMFGGPGNDTMIGGRGDDFYLLIGGGKDVIRENAGGGTDSVIVSATQYTLGRNVENLQFGNLDSNMMADVRGIGNALNNKIDGGDGNDRLSGKAGNDSLSGGYGHDSLTGGSGADVFAFGVGQGDYRSEMFGANSDTVTDFVSGVDHLLLSASEFAVNAIRPDMKAAQFGLEGTALTGKEVVLYDQDTGILTDKAGHVFASVTPGLALTYHDFIWA